MTTMEPMHPNPPPHSLPPLGEGIPIKLELRNEAASLVLTEAMSSTVSEQTPTTNDFFSFRQTESAVTTFQPVSTTTVVNNGRCNSPDVPPPSPPRLFSKSPAHSRKGSMRIPSMDDSYCDRIRSTSSFGWYDESTAFESIDVPQSAFREIEDWRDLNAWDGGRNGETTKLETAPHNVQFQVPHAHVTATKTFRAGFSGRPEAYTIAIGATRVIRVSAYTSHAEYQVMMSTNNHVYKMWKRFSDFKLLAEYAKISDLRDTINAWRRIQQTQRWFRCLDANYLKSKCNLLEKFLAQLLFEVPSPSLLLTFVGAHAPDFKRR